MAAVALRRDPTWPRRIAPMNVSRNRLPFVLLVVEMIVATSALLAGQFLALGEVHAAHAASPLALTAVVPQRGSDNPILAKAYRFERGGWIYVHLEGAPHDIGYQHGYLLAPEIADAFQSFRLEATHNSGRDWEFFRRAAREMLWPKIDPEYQAELQGIVDGLQANKTKLDLDDIVALNAFQELADYYVPWLDAQTRTWIPPRPETPGHCSAFVATGSWT